MDGVKMWREPEENPVAQGTSSTHRSLLTYRSFRYALYLEYVFDAIIRFYRGSQIRSSRTQPLQVSSSCDLIEEYCSMMVLIHRMHLIVALALLLQ